MNFKRAPVKEPQSIFLLSLLAFFELFSSGVFTLLIAPDPKSALIFGLSATRLLLVVGIWALAIIFLVAGILARKNKLSLDDVFLVTQSENLRRTIYAFSFALILWGWLSLFSPPYLFGKQIYIFERVRPFSIALGVSLAQTWLFFLFARGRLGLLASGKSSFQKYFRPILLFAVLIIGLGIFIASTKFGLLPNLVYSNDPGIPLSGLQWFLILLLVGLWIALVLDQEQTRPFFKIVKRYRLIPILIFITTVLVWGFTPLRKDFFSLFPAAPSFQPFPLSDARTYDLGAISILRGYGIYFRINIDKPLYMIFLAILHFFAGFNYLLMTWMQIFVLAFIPVILFLLGEKFHSTALGIFLSAVLIIRQRNAIALSYKISSVNPKLFMTEEMTLLGVVLFAYLVFLWMRNRKIWLALLCGGCIGATALVRLNPIILFPAVICAVLPGFWGMGKRFILSHLSAYTLAFLFLLITWILSSVNPQGTPWLWLKLQFVLDQRFRHTNSSIQGNMNISPPVTGTTVVTSDGNAIPTLQSTSQQNQATYDSTNGTLSENVPAITTPANLTHGIAYLFLNHLLQNFSTSVLSLPDSLKYDDLDHLSQRLYWSDPAGWSGDLPPIQTGLVFFNLLLIVIGLGYSWVHQRWAGMIPLIIFIAYSVLTSAVMDSGGRYLVPMDWTLYFYYGLAIVVIFKFIRYVLTGKEQSQPIRQDSGGGQQISERRNLGFSLAGIILLASLIPMANFVLPSITPSTRNPVNVDAVRDKISKQEGPGAVIMYGEILYPYYEKGIMTFDLLTSSGAMMWKINRPPILKAKLSSGETAFVALRNDAKGHSQVQSIYLWQGENPVLVWHQSQ